MRLRRALTQTANGCDDASRMGTPRQPARGGGVWRTRATRATTVALVLCAFLGGLAQPASADDPITEALKRKDELARAVELSRANAERYQAVANQFQAVVNQTNARIADLADKQANAQSEADQLFYQIQIAEEQLALVTFQLDETRTLADTPPSHDVPAGADQSARDAPFIGVPHRIREPSPGNDLHQPTGRAACERDPHDPCGHTAKAR